MFDRTITVEQRLWRLTYTSTLMVGSLKFNHDSDNKLSFFFFFFYLDNLFNVHMEQDLDFDQTWLFNN